MCGKLDVACQVTEGVGTVVGDAFEVMLQKLSESALASLHTQATFWLSVSSPTLAEERGGRWTDSRSIAFLHEQVLSVSWVIFGLAILIAGLRIAWEQRAEPLRQLLKATMTFLLVSAAGTATLQLLTAWSDEFSKTIVSAALPPTQSFEEAMKEVTGQGATGALQQMPVYLLAFSTMTVLFGSLIQIVLLMIRSAMLVLLAGVFPLAAVATNTEIGKAWFKKFCGWALAFIAYKPAAALIYAAAIRMTHEGMFNKSGDGLVQTLTGLMMLGLAVIALPALLRFAVPLTAAAAGGSSATGASVADPGGLASGAINVGRSSGGGSGFGGGGGGFGAGGGGGGGSGGGGGGGSAAGAIGVAAGTAGAVLTASKKAAGAMSGAASHSAGESGGGSSSGSSGSSSARSGGSRSGGGWSSTRPSTPGGSSTPRAKPPPPPAPTPQAPEPSGPTGNW